MKKVLSPLTLGSSRDSDSGGVFLALLHSTHQLTSKENINDEAYRAVSSALTFIPALNLQNLGLSSIFCVRLSFRA